MNIEQNNFKLILSKLKKGTIGFLSNIITFIQVNIKRKPTYCKTSWSAMQEWKYSVSILKNRKENGKSIVLVAFRNATWIEWSIFAAYKYYSMGYKPIVYYSSDDIRNTYTSILGQRWMVFHFWRAALKTQFIEFVDIDSLSCEQIPADSKYQSLALDLAHTMAAYNLRVEEYELDVFPDKYQKEYEKSYSMLLRYCNGVEKSLIQHIESRIICPNGLIEKSVIFYAISLKIKLNIFFIEGWARRLGHMIWSENRPVMFYNIDGWTEIVGGWDESKEKDYRAMLNFQNLTEVPDDDWFNGFIPVQRAAKDSQFSSDFQAFLAQPGVTFLAGTNVIGDSATLRRSRIFRNQKEWLSKLIPFFGNNPNLKLVIRIHPDEVFPKAVVKLGELIADSVSQYPNIFLFKAEDDINTNTLIQIADIGLAWVSNFGVDMVLHGKPTIIAGKSNYMELKIGIYPDTQQTYFDQIVNLAQQITPLDYSMIERAKIYQRIVFREMSLEATSNSYDARDYRINSEREPRDRTTFFKILCGELDSFGR